jgi:VanZ family protein
MLKKFAYYWLPLLLWCYLIYFLSSLQNLRTDLPDNWDFILRKMAHMVEYAVLYMLTYRALSNSLAGQDKKKLMLVSAVFAVLYACSDEFHQSFVPTRGSSVRDVMIDSVGTFIGYHVYNYLSRFKYFKNAL